MEQIKVNMTPCGFTPTIHASQDDNSTRKWGFELYDEDGKIDSSSIKEQMIFDSRVGGTEQILPENTSDSTTSPIIADIQYPDSLRSDQIFTYRESPTQEDGQAKITRIKGNTVVFNQLVPTNWASSGGAAGVTYTNNGDGSYTFNGTSTGTRFISTSSIVAKANHKYFVNVGNNSNTGLNITINGLGSAYYVKTKGIISLSTDSSFLMFYEAGASFNNLKVWPQIFDLTQMGLDTLTVDQFTSLFSLPYYDYTQGKLLPFKGESLKTTGKNLFNISDIPRPQNPLNGVYFSVSNQVIKLEGVCTSNVSVQALNVAMTLRKGVAYTFSGTNGASDSTFFMQVVDNPVTRELFHINNTKYTYTPTEDTDILIRPRLINGATINAEFIFQVEFGSVQTSIEPYTSSTINLPILDYFPTGMKDCSQSSQVFDEKTESEAITRVGEKNLGNYSWADSTNGWTQAQWAIADAKSVSNNQTPNIKTANFEAHSANDVFNRVYDNSICYNASGVIQLYNSSFANKTGVEIKDALTGQLFYYELATPTKESITTASLVTEKGEAPLYYDDGLVADCNENISAKSGMFDAKIKLMTDETIYSQKIQLHVERKPQ